MDTPTPFFATSISCLRYANAGFAVSASRTPRLEFLFEQCRELAGNISRYESVFEKNSNDELLYRAFTGGELSLLDYLLELEYYFNSYEKLMQTQRDLRLALAELYAYEL